MMKIITLIFCSLLAIAFVGNVEAASQKLLPIQEKLQIQKETCRTISKGAAMSAAARHTDGKVLSASLNSRARPPVYRVKVLTESGRVRHIYVDACTGRVR